MRKLIGIAIVLCLLTSLGLTVSAASPRLVDHAGLLNSAEAEALEEKLDQISIRHGVDVVIVTVSSTGATDPQDFADDWFDYNDYATDGILLLVSMEERDWHISTTGYGITAFTDAGLEYMADQFVPLLSDGAYAEAFDTFAELCDAFFAQARTGDPYDSHNLPKEPFHAVVNLIICLVIGLVVAFIATGSMKKELHTVRKQIKADTYIEPGTLKLTGSQDLFLYSQVTKIAKPKPTSGSSTHTSSSGRTHGGRGGKF